MARRDAEPLHLPPPAPNSEPPESTQNRLFIMNSHQQDAAFRFVTQYIVTLVDVQLDAPNSYLFTYNTFIKILYVFRALPCSSSGGLRRNFIHAASGIVTLYR
jgi:hypothetical protein